ncbi:acyltransferase [Lithospermum erythrorhizon]|uniref:Acyltransferase n=1 Tax=Lithospermum erythrorhizon TaxID=34254 RepID=A0AAV3PG18_LITER
MTGRKELGLPKLGVRNLKDQLVKTTLRNVRSQGHTYIELREDGKRLVFFCTLCMAPCYSDSILYHHLNGNLHRKMYAAAKATLLKTNPFPFNDGVNFFHDSTEHGGQCNVSKPDGLMSLASEAEDADREDLAIVCYDEKATSSSSEHTSFQQDVNKIDTCSIVATESDRAEDGQISKSDGGNSVVVVPSVLLKDEASDLAVTHTGFGQITARLHEKDGCPNEISRIWCEWIGKEDLVDSSIASMQEHEFAVVTFSYNYSFGRKGFLDDLKLLFLPSPRSGSEETVDAERKKRESFSDPEDVSKSANNECDSSEEESQVSTNLNSRSLIDGTDDQLISSRISSSKRMRKELRHLKSVAAERSCYICQLKMFPGKDVAALLNRNTGRMACSSRNFTGAFHVFHVSCLIHWILLCELEIYSKKPVAPAVKRKSRRKTGAKNKVVRKTNEIKITGNQAHSLFCPECQGTGMKLLDEKELERPTVPLSEIFRFKIKVSDGYRAWMESPEVVPNSSTGLYFPPQTDHVPEDFVSSLKLICFYRADDTGDEVGEALDFSV